MSQNLKVAETHDWKPWSGFFLKMVLLCESQSRKVKWNSIEKFEKSHKSKSRRKTDLKLLKHDVYHIFEEALYSYRTMKGCMVEEQCKIINGDTF